MNGAESRRNRLIRFQRVRETEIVSISGLHDLQKIDFPVNAAQIPDSGIKGSFSSVFPAELEFMSPLPVGVPFVAPVMELENRASVDFQGAVLGNVVLSLE